MQLHQKGYGIGLAVILVSIIFARPVVNEAQAEGDAVFSQVLPEDSFTELFDAANIDLSYTTLTFIPDGSSAHYKVCKLTADKFPTDPKGGTYVVLLDDDAVEVVLINQKRADLYGTLYDRFYIGSNGYITFGAPDIEYVSTLQNHFDLPRISALFTDLTPANSISVSWKQLDDRVAVTYEKVPLQSDKTAVNNFQIEMFFADGTIRLTWLELKAKQGIVGLSKGLGIPPLFVKSDLSSYACCCDWGDFDGNGYVDAADLMLLVMHWLNDSCGAFDWCDRADIDRSSRVDAADFTAVSENWTPDVEPEWSQPALLAELNGPLWGTPALLTELNDGENTAEGPCLSRDGLRMYFTRYIPAFGHPGIVEASRTATDKPFTSQRVLTELRISGSNFVHPWVSVDGLRLYYNEVVNNQHFLKMAVRTKVGDPWTPAKTFNELHVNNYNDNEPSLTDDELVIFFCSNRPGSFFAGTRNIWMAVRPSTDAPFSNLRAIDETNSIGAEYQPHIMSDGLTLYFASDRYRNVISNIYRSTRASRNDMFSIVELVPISTAYQEGCPHVTPDERTIYFGSNRGAAGKGIFVSYSENVPNWSAPILLSELNDGENTVEGPCLSRDGLRMYFTRYIPAFGHPGIVEASRTAIDKPFTTQRVLTELRISGSNFVQPWVSVDGLRLYYTEMVNNVHIIKMAARAHIGDTWISVKTFTELHVNNYGGNEPSLTDDELVIFFCSTRPGSLSGGTRNIWMAVRPSTDAPFGTPRPLDEINSDKYEYQPCVMPDGLTLYFDSNRPDNIDRNIFRATRTSRNDQFSKLELVPVSTTTYQEGGPHVTPDERTIYFSSDRGAEGKGIFVSYIESETAGEPAYGPCLSRDGLRIYFARHIPVFGHPGIVEASRTAPDGPFTSERVLTELRISGSNFVHPWVSVDGLRLYYTEIVNSVHIIKMASRTYIGDKWTPIKIFTELHINNYGGNEPSLTDDELVICFCSNRPGSLSGGERNMWMAVRQSTDAPFGTPRPLDEINSDKPELSPCVMPDGLTLYFSSNRNSIPECIYKATRTSRNELFGNLELVPVSTTTYKEFGPHVTPDERIIYFDSDRGARGSGIWITHFGKIFKPCVPR